MSASPPGFRSGGASPACSRRGRETRFVAPAVQSRRATSDPEARSYILSNQAPKVIPTDRLCGTNHKNSDLYRTGGEVETGCEDTQLSLPARAHRREVCRSRWEEGFLACRVGSLRSAGGSAGASLEQRPSCITSRDPFSLASLLSVVA